MPSTATPPALPATYPTVAIITTRQQAEGRERDFSTAALVGLSLISLLLVGCGILLIHNIHGFDGAVFTAAVFAVLIGINIIGYIAIVYILSFWNEAMSKRHGYAKLGSEESHLD